MIQRIKLTKNNYVLIIVIVLNTINFYIIIVLNIIKTQLLLNDFETHEIFKKHKMKNDYFLIFKFCWMRK